MSTLARLVLAALLAGAAILSPPAAREAGAQSPAAARDLPRGHVLEAGDIVASSALDGSTDGTAHVQPGWITRRVVREGELLRAPAVAPPPTVARGDAVTVRWNIEGVQITMPGVALGDAEAGDSILVRLDALRRVSAVVRGPSTVDVP